MKFMTMAAALMLGTAAVAQTAPQEETETTTSETTTSETETETAPAPDATTSIPPTATTAPAPGNMSTMRGSGQTVAAGNGSPETDARGIRVLSAPAEAPAGYNQGARTVPAGSAMPTVAPPTPTAAGPLPPCTRTVTDRCTQTYERGRAR
ncbi:MAG TPA: hypothetical protein VF645_11045 [Allosphingosinicella sp.]|jgi:hypothetical protein